MLRSTTSSGTKRFDAGHRAERIFVSALFACPASALRNERGIGELSMIPKRMDSMGKTALRPSHSLIPQVLLFEFFFLYALERQITESKNDQQYMPSPAGPASALVVIQAQFRRKTFSSPCDSMMEGTASSLPSICRSPRETSLHVTTQGSTPWDISMSTAGLLFVARFGVRNAAVFCSHGHRVALFLSDRVLGIAFVLVCIIA